MWDLQTFDVPTKQEQSAQTLHLVCNLVTEVSKYRSPEPQMIPHLLWMYSGGPTQGLCRNFGRNLENIDIIVQFVPPASPEMEHRSQLWVDKGWIVPTSSVFQ